MGVTVTILWEIVKEIKKSREEIAKLRTDLRTAIFPSPALSIDDTYPKRILIRLQEIEKAVNRQK